MESKMIELTQYEIELIKIALNIMESETGSTEALVLREKFI